MCGNACVHQRTVSIHFHRDMAIQWEQPPSQPLNMTLRNAQNIRNFVQVTLGGGSLILLLCHCTSAAGGGGGRSTFGLSGIRLPQPSAGGAPLAPEAPLPVPPPGPQPLAALPRHVPGHGQRQHHQQRPLQRQHHRHQHHIQRPEVSGVVCHSGGGGGGVGQKGAVGVWPAALGL